MQVYVNIRIKCPNALLNGSVVHVIRIYLNEIAALKALENYCLQKPSRQNTVGVQFLGKWLN